MERISTQSLNALFDFFSEQSNTVIWMHSQDYQRQIYLSPTFESIWHAKSEHLYNAPSNWGKYLHSEDQERARQHIKTRLMHPDKIDKDVLLYRIYDDANNLKFLKSSAFLLTGDDNRDFAYFGITQVVNELEWESEFNKNTISLASGSQSEMRQYLFHILQNELRLTVKISDNNSSDTPSGQKIMLLDKGNQISLTQREADCIYHLVQGKSAKQTAHIMNISARTVEFHLGNVKDKANCRTKLELISKIILKDTDINAK